MHRAIQGLAARLSAKVNATAWLVCLTAAAAVLSLLSGCKSPPPPQSAVDQNIARVSTAGLRLGMTPAEIREVCARRLYKEDTRNEDTLAGLMQKERERATIRLDRVRMLTTYESFAFHSNAVSLTLQFARNRLVHLEERHTNLGESDLRATINEVSAQFPFVINRTETGSGAQWEYQGKNPGAYVRIDFRFVTNPNVKAVPMSSYRIVMADPSWATNGDLASKSSIR